MGTEIVCPACEQSDFDSTRAMRIHHKLKHNESIAGINFTCDFCGTEFNVKSRSDRDGDRAFCSDECKGKWYSENLTGEASPHWEQRRIECENCGKKYSERPFRIESNERNFCSPGCSQDFKVGKNHPLFKRRSVKCDNCGESLIRPPSRIRDHNFCDLVCHGEWRSKNLVGENAPSWSGGYIRYYGPSWREQRVEAILRAAGRCELCGMSESTHHRLRGHGLHVHHKIPFTRFGQENHLEANSLSNLIVLCKKCHENIEGISQRK